METKRKWKKTLDMNREQTLRFIAEVKKHPCLWDRTMERNKDKHERDTAWEKLSTSLGYNADDLVEKWASLRASMRTYRCVLRKRKKASDGDWMPFVKWPYFTAMLFTVGEEAASSESLQKCGRKTWQRQEEDIESPIIAPPKKIRLPVDDDDPDVTGEPPLVAPKQEESAIEQDSEETTFQPQTEIRLPAMDLDDTGEPPSKQPNHETPIKEPSSDEIPTSSTSQEPLILRRVPRPPMDRPVKMIKLVAKPRVREPEFVAVKAEPLSNPPSPPPPEPAQGCRVMVGQDEDEIFGHTIALQLKQFAPKTKKKLRIQIHDLIAKAQKRAFEKQFGVPYDSNV